MTQKEILFIIASLGYGGAEKMLVELVNRFEPSLFKIHIIVLSNKLDLLNQITIKPLDLKIIQRKWRFDISIIKDIHEYIIEKNIQKIITFGFYEYFFIKFAVYFLKKKPTVVISIHSTTQENTYRDIQKWALVRLLGKPEIIVAVCNNQAKYWSKRYWIPLDRFITIYNGIDVEHFNPLMHQNTSLQIRKMYSIPDEAFVISTVGRLDPHKRHEDLIEALSYFLESYKEYNLYLMIIGGGSEKRKKDLQDLSRSLAIQDKIIFIGQQEDVRPYLISSDIFSLVSNKRETFSIAALEAMAMGLPCALTNIGGAPEMIEEGINGYLVSPEDPKSIAEGWLKIKLNIDEFDRNLIREKICNEFNINNCVSKYQQIFTDR